MDNSSPSSQRLHGASSSSSSSTGNEEYGDLRSIFSLRRESPQVEKRPSCLTHEHDLAKEEKTILDLISSSISLPTGVASHYKTSDQCLVCVEYKRGDYVDYLTAQVGLGKTFRVFAHDITTNLVLKGVVLASERDFLRFSLVEFRSVYGTHTQTVIIWISAEFPENVHALR